MFRDIDSAEEIITTAARQELLPRFARVERGIKQDGSFVTEADLAAQARIESELQRRWPGIACLGEEMPADRQAGLLRSDHPVWCLDPLDGTSNFASGTPYFSVSLALLQGGEVVFGMVYDPNRDELFTARKGEGARLNGDDLVLSESGLSLSQSTALIDFKRLSETLAVRLVSQRPYASQRSFGSVALDWCWLAAGRVQLYLHGRSNVWDYASGNLIFLEAGGYASTLEGEAVFLNALRPRSCVGAVDQQLFAAWSDWLGIGQSGRSASDQ